MKIAAVAAAAALLVSTAAFAQTPESNQTINQRKGDQQQRIGQGVESGQLTARETGHLEHQENAINREEHNMRAADNGHLTRSDRQTLHAQQNQESRRIYRDKHNARMR
ncbi:MAG: hypothetical protein INR71_15860 [Terriglobus roseus]|nr:hypothetical protein [Terriglobus roseus]